MDEAIKDCILEYREFVFLGSLEEASMRFSFSVKRIFYEIKYFLRLL